MGELIDLAEWRKKKEEAEMEEALDELDEMEEILRSLMKNIGIPVEYHPQYSAYIFDEEGEVIPLTLNSSSLEIDEDDKS